MARGAHPNPNPNPDPNPNPNPKPNPNPTPNQVARFDGLAAWPELMPYLLQAS